MIICEPCKTEMTCQTTGVRAVWGEGHVYAGDRFHCKNCGAVVAVLAGVPTHEPDVRTKYPPNKVIEMEAP